MPISLNSQHDEVELEAAVTEVFRKYGTVYVKITRDKKNMPMGFVQFTVSILSPSLHSIHH